MTHVAVERVRMTWRSVIFGMRRIVSGLCPPPLGTLRSPDPYLILPGFARPSGGEPPNPHVWYDLSCEQAWFGCIGPAGGIAADGRGAGAGGVPVCVGVSAAQSVDPHGDGAVCN